MFLAFNHQWQRINDTENTVTAFVCPMDVDLKADSKRGNHGLNNEMPANDTYGAMM